MSVNINSYKLSIDGLTITYTYKQESATLFFDPKATCELFEHVGMIEGFDIDKNGEPIIYYTERIWCRPATAFCLWFEFVKTFPFIQRHAEILVEHLADAREFKKTYDKIDNLLSLIRHS
jgi:hypothetical protein